MDTGTIGELLTLGFLGLTGWKTGYLHKILDWTGGATANLGAYLLSPDGAKYPLAEQLDYRDFFGDYIETKHGWIWAGLELEPFPVEGFSAKDWKIFGNRFNRLITMMKPGTAIQFYRKIDNKVDDALAVLERQVAENQESPLLPVAIARLNHFKARAANYQIKNSRLFIFFGRQAKANKVKLSLAGLTSPNPFVDIEREKLIEICSEVEREREKFLHGYQHNGGRAWTIRAREVFEQAYQDLNPTRAKVVAAPRYIEPVRLPDQVVDQANREKHSHTNRYELDSLRAERFAENPRKTLCFTRISVEKNYFLYGDVPCCTLSIQCLPTSVFPGLMGQLTSAELGFDVRITSYFQIKSRQQMDSWLSNVQVFLDSYAGTSTKPTLDDKDANKSIDEFRMELRKSQKRMGLFGLGITFFAKDLPELNNRRDKLLSLFHELEGAEAYAEADNPRALHFGTLPCVSYAEGDSRLKRIFSNEFVALSPLTGSDRGIEKVEATDVFVTKNGEPFYWNPFPKQFICGHSMIVGPSGSGKTGWGISQVISDHFQGRRTLVFDFGGSFRRICLALAGQYYDIADPRRTKGIPVFAIRPHVDEEYEPDELTPEGLPVDRLASVEYLLEKLCLDPNNPADFGLAPEKISYLRDAVRRTYARLVDRTPIIDDFIYTLEMATREDRGMARELAARLKIYASTGSLGRFLNNRSEPLPVDTSISIFDFLSAADANDPRALLIAVIAVGNHTHRFLHVDRHIPKSIRFDELAVISKHRVICEYLEEFSRTARKLNTILTFSSQAPEDFNTNEAMRSIMTNTEVKVLFPMPDLDMAEEALKLAPGELKALADLQIGGKEHREALIIYPHTGLTRGCAKIRIEFNKLEARLCLGAGRELVTFEEAMAEIDGEASQSLVAALKGDALEMDVNKTLLADSASFQ